MKSQIACVCFVILFAQGASSRFLPQTANREKVAAFSFAGVKYFHRYTEGDQHEYTPAGQEDLNAWTDMVTLLLLPDARDGEALAAAANRVLETYKADGAVVVKTGAIPRTRVKAAEYLIVVNFGRPEFIEAVFARFRMHDGVGSAVIYSHRVYGKKVGDQMSTWLGKNGLITERNLMKWVAMPKLLPSR